MRKIIFIFLISIFLNCSSDIQKNFISLFVITEELEIGDNRVVLTALDENGNTLTNDLRFFLRKLDRKETIEIKNKNISSWPPNRNVFITKINFDEVGYWEFIVRNGKDEAKATVNVKQDSKILNVGDFIEPLNTPSIGEYNISEISTDINPNKDFYKHSIAEALSEKKPIFITFATPGLCVTGTCSPQLEELKKISNDYNDLIIIHIEIWKNFKEVMDKGDLSIGKLNDSVEKFGIKTEPWTFLINTEGKIKNRYQGFVESKELKTDLESIREY